MGHISIPGNEKADSKAKKAASGLSLINELLPPYLRKPLLINPSAVLRANNDTLNKEWSQDWCKTKRGKRMLKIDSTIPSAKLLKMLSNTKLSQVAASRLAQLRLQHFPLNKYLHRFKRTDKPNCPACGNDKETIAHFLLHYMKYAFERWALAQQVRKRKKELTIEILLGDPELALPLANYIKGTGHFKVKSDKYAQNQNITTA